MVIDERTVEITSAVPDPKLPVLGVYILPKHIWEPIATDYDAATQYDPGADVPGSGPFVVTEYTKGQSVVLEANPNYYGWEGEEPPYDKIIFQLFENPDAMVAAPSSRTNSTPSTDSPPALPISSRPTRTSRLSPDSRAASTRSP